MEKAVGVKDWGYTMAMPTPAAMGSPAAYGMSVMASE